MEEKKRVTISLGTAICMIIIFLLVIALILLGIYTYALKNTNTQKSNISSNTDVADASQSATVDTSKDEVTKPVENVGTELNINDSIVKTLTDKIDFNKNAKASIYKIGNFNSTTIPNDLMLQLGWDKKINNPNLVEGAHGNLYVKVTKEEMKQAISDIFGPKIQYTDTSFFNYDIKTFDAYNGCADVDRYYKLFK